MQQKTFRLTPFTDEEVPAAVQELFNHSGFLKGMETFVSKPFYNYILKAKDNIKTIDELQQRLIVPFIELVERISITNLSVSGLDGLMPNEKYLFISNHRDIVLDSAFLNVVLYRNGRKTSQIAIGDNLMAHPISELMFRLNKSFVVKRSGTMRELYHASVELSKYIQHLISYNKEAVWLAQRQGRAKDGNDETQEGLIKMLSLGAEKPLKEHFQALKIVPVAITYEYDPCAVQKTQEFLNKRANPDYKKSFREDLQYILQGIRGAKGRVHFHFGKPLNDQLEILDDGDNDKQRLNTIREMVDKTIHQNYQLHPVNYIAYDLLHESQKYQSFYTEKEWHYHNFFFNRQIRQLKTEEMEEGREYLLGIYANPVINGRKWF